ncbi:unnamed protein product [Closterium sp. Naga37s-1]|nr:unnamed protein product [Closterium sp. Naga37s-1]
MRNVVGRLDNRLFAVTRLVGSFASSALRMPPSQPPPVSTGGRPPPPRRAGAHGGNGGATKKRGRENETGTGKEAGGGDAARIYAEVNSGAQQDVMRAVCPADIAVAPARGSGGGASSDPLAGVEARIAALLASGGRRAGGGSSSYSVPRMEVLLEVPGGKKRAGKDVVRRGGSVAEAGGREAGKRSRQRSRAGGVERLVWELKARPHLCRWGGEGGDSRVGRVEEGMEKGGVAIFTRMAPLAAAWSDYAAALCRSAAAHPPAPATPAASASEIFFSSPLCSIPPCPPIQSPPYPRCPRRMGAWVAAMDLHGAMLTVTRAASSGHVGVGGMVLAESTSAFHLITRDDRLKVIPKQGSEFRLHLPPLLLQSAPPKQAVGASPPQVPQRVVTLQGDLMRTRPRMRYGDALRPAAVSKRLRSALPCPATLVPSPLCARPLLAPRSPPPSPLSSLVHPSNSPHSPLSLPSLTSLYPLNPPSLPPPLGGMSVAAVFVNKAIFRVYRFTFPYTLVFFQTLFTLTLLAAMRLSRAIRLAPFRLSVLRRVRPSLAPCPQAAHGHGAGARGSGQQREQRGAEGRGEWSEGRAEVALLSFAFLLKLLLDMAALSRVNIPMYGVLKSATTPFVLLLDYLLRAKRASLRVQLSVYMTALGGVIAGTGDLTFDLPGYVLALSSALATAAYVVIVGKLGEELQLDSFTLLLYNNCWSLPFSFLLLALNGELPAVQRVLQSRDAMFLTCFVLSCASAFVLNLATYLCTLVNDSLTTSIVGRTKSILQGLGGLFAFGDVLMSVTNVVGLLVNSAGIGWYAVEKYLEARRRSHHMLSPGHARDGKATITRDGSQLSLVFNEVKTEDAGQPDPRNGSV